MTTQDEAPAGSRKFNPWARHRARRLALQALYQWQVSGTELAQLLAEFATNDGMKRVDPAYFTDIVTGVIRGVERIDATLGPQLEERTIAQLDPIERAALRIGVFELLERLDVPARVVIDEGVGLSQAFGSEHSHSYVNGVLDALARSLRAAEMQGSRPPRREPVAGEDDAELEPDADPDALPDLDPDDDASDAAGDAAGSNADLPRG